MDRQLVSSGSPFEQVAGFSRAVRVGDRVVVAGTAPIWPDDVVDPSVEVQTRRCLEIIRARRHAKGATDETNSIGELVGDLTADDPAPKP